MWASDSRDAQQLLRVISPFSSCFSEWMPGSHGFFPLTRETSLQLCGLCLFACTLLLTLSSFFRQSIVMDRRSPATVSTPCSRTLRRCPGFVCVEIAWTCLRLSRIDSTASCLAKTYSGKRGLDCWWMSQKPRVFKRHWTLSDFWFWTWQLPDC